LNDLPPLQGGESGDLMVNNLLMLIKLDTDTIALLSLIASIVAVIVSLIAIFAVFHSKRPTTKDDLPRVKERTERLEQPSTEVASVSTRMHQLEEPKALEAQPQHVSISIEGEALGDVPLELLVTVQDSSVRVSRVERLTEAGKTLGSTRCKATDDALVFKSILAQEKVSQWWDAEELIGDGGIRSVLRVYLLLDKGRREVYRDVPVSIVNDWRNVGIAKLVVWNIKGSI